MPPASRPLHQHRADSDSKMGRGSSASTHDALLSENALDGRVDAGSASFAANAARMAEQTERVRALTEAVHGGGGEKACALHRSRGKMLPRERIEQIVDPGSPFLELSALAGHELYGDEVIPSGGIVNAWGEIRSRVISVGACDGQRGATRCVFCV